jgi:hypothetical protein
MGRWNRTAVVALVAALALPACSERSLVAPDASPGGVSFAAIQSLPGTYVLSFMIETSSGLGPIADGIAAPTGTYLVLKSEVRDNGGTLATVGSVTYEYCWSRGNYAPKSTCDSGAGSWRRLFSMSIDPVGQLAGFGSCSTPRSIGFRFTYAGRKSGISDGVSASKDFTWI